MNIIRQSPVTGVFNEMDIPIDPDKYFNWMNNPDSPNIQNAFPELSDDEREFILTGITSEEWDVTFKDSDDEEKE